MGLLDRLNKGLQKVGGMSGMPSMEEPSSLGRVRVNTTGTLDLPAGEVALWYQVPRTQWFREESDGEPIIVEPGDLVINVRPAAGGDPLALSLGSGRSHSMSDLKHERCQIGTVQIPAPGSYSVESSSQEAPGAAELLFDG